jgi:glycerol kinase
MAGGIVNWLRLNLGILDKVADSSKIASSVSPDSKVVLVPAFSGLGAPHWSAEARGSLFGMTQDTGVKELVHASLQSISLQTNDLIDAIQKDFSDNNLDLLASLKIDGGMIENDWFNQNLADICNYEIQKSFTKESTALGAAMIAGLGVGYYSGLDNFKGLYSENDKIIPIMDSGLRKKIINNWSKALKLSIQMAK